MCHGILKGNVMENSLQKAEQTIKSLLVGSQFESFTFHTHFILFFARTQDSRALKEDCYSVKIEILSDWIFGSEEEWEKCKTKFDLSNCIEENEPVQSFLLAKLRWSEGATIKNISLSREILTLEFENGQVINIENDDIMDFAWIIEDSNKNQNNDWSIVAEFKEIYVTL